MVSRLETEAVVVELQRVRYGARQTWAEPAAVFRRAGQALRAARRAGRPAERQLGLKG